jgi:hypothetical protein
LNKTESVDPSPMLIQAYADAYGKWRSVLEGERAAGNKR